MLNDHCTHCHDGYPLPEKEAAENIGGYNEMYLSNDDGNIWLTAVPDDPYYEFGTRVRFCPWCGRELHVKGDIKN